MPEKTKILAEKASELLSQGKPLSDFYVEGTLDIHKLADPYNKELVIRNCTIENLESYATEFTRPVVLLDSIFHKCTFSYSFFTDGLLIQNCIFESYLDFEAGGHNQKVININGNIFKGFVNFFDCWYQNQVHVTANNFLKGANLNGNKGEGFEVSFDIDPIIGNNIGRLDLDGDGDKPYT